MEKEEKTNDNSAKVTLRPRGPLVIAGDFEVTNEEGKLLEKRPIMSICRCTLSKNMPFCDGSHKGAWL